MLPQLRRILEQYPEIWQHYGDAAPTPLETLLAERIVTVWLELQLMEAQAAAAEGEGPRVTQMRLKRQDSAHRRYVQAVKALALPPADVATSGVMQCRQLSKTRLVARRVLEKEILFSCII